MMGYSWLFTPMMNKAMTLCHISIVREWWWLQCIVMASSFLCSPIGMHSGLVMSLCTRKDDVNDRNVAAKSWAVRVAAMCSTKPAFKFYSE